MPLLFKAMAKQPWCRISSCIPKDPNIHKPSQASQAWVHRVEHLYKTSSVLIAGRNTFAGCLKGLTSKKSIMTTERIRMLEMTENQACLVRLQTTLHRMAWVANAICGDARPANASQPSQTHQNMQLWAKMLRASLQRISFWHQMIENAWNASCCIQSSKTFSLISVIATGCS